MALVSDWFLDAETGSVSPPLAARLRGSVLQGHVTAWVAVNHWKAAMLAAI